MPTQAGANLTAIASDEPDGNVYVTGFGDGVVRLFDKRVEKADQVVIHTWRKHHTWIQSVHVQRAGLKELVTGRSAASFSLTETQLSLTTQYERRSPDMGRTLSRCSVVRRYGPTSWLDGTGCPSWRSGICDHICPVWSCRSAETPYPGFFRSSTSESLVDSRCPHRSFISSRS